MMALGNGLQRLRVIDQTFINTASRLVFTVCLPILLFLSIQNAELPSGIALRINAIAALVTLAVFILLWLIAPILVAESRDRGVFIQGSFRSNLAIMGLALADKAYGEEGLAIASMIMAFITVLYNVLSVVALSSSLRSDTTSPLRAIVKGIVTNPLIIAILASIGLKFTGLRLPTMLTDSGQYFAQMSLPLALLCIGGSLSFRSLRGSSSLTLWASFIKLCVLPGLTIVAAVYFGVRGVPLGVLFLMVSAPTAAASYVMVEAMKGNSALAANIIAMSTVWSIVTVSFGLLLLKSMELI
jgi:predicted permease